ncbi:MAG: GatB/YqeY domain-containing protein [Bryobacterales bacterium]|nr:GatB/YqeY domain-containing protein [Bryobacterales bacterium]
MSLIERIQKDMVEAMKAKQETRLAAVRFIKTALLKYKADNMKEADEQAAQQLLNTLLKQRRESADMFRKGGREELAAKEEAEITVIEGYMPAMATDADIDAALAAALAETGITSAKQMGVVMKAVQAHLAGKRVDGKALSDKVRARLGERA